MERKTPIYTKITNLTDKAFTFGYAGKDSIWLGAHDTVLVQHELWSVLDWKQREGLIASIIAQQISLRVGILQTNGEYAEFDYQPNLAFGLVVEGNDVPAAAVTTEAPAEEEKAAEAPAAQEPVVEELKAEEPAEDQPVEEVASGPADESKWALVAKAVEEKRWAEAADMLNAMGANPQATARSLMSLKDRSVEAIKAKYNIA